MEGIRFARNRQNTLFGGNFLPGNTTRPGAHIEVLRSPPPWVFCFQIKERSFEIEIPCILLFQNRNKNS